MITMEKTDISNGVELKLLFRLVFLVGLYSYFSSL